MSRLVAVLLIALLWCVPALGQGVVGEVLSGKLVKPAVGTWAWYDLKDSQSKSGYMVRIAIVGEEKVKGKAGYWLELEVVPMLGYRSVYKMLVTGPASDPANIHKMLQREGAASVEEIKINHENDAGAKPEKEAERKSVGMDEVATAAGPVKAEHYEVGEGNAKSELWLNEEIPPMGIVRLKSAEGELVLKGHGTDGPEARSVINDSPLPGKPAPEDGVKVEVRAVQPPPEKQSTVDKPKDKAKAPRGKGTEKPKPDKAPEKGKGQ